ncbi:MAG: 30S ribosomal protein S12 methylthiotransferase RimO [Clostridia bacterium]|nr:30S ribosomal protein S12 methylthiotransferase RimO [Clostridia bacterium]
MIKNKKIGIISLGCDKNRVDTEKMIFLLRQNHIIVNDQEKAEIIVINTCAFLESARKEAISEIFNAVKLKQTGNVKKIIVTGCLPQKFIDDIFSELVEVDAFLGVSDYTEILSVIDRIYKGERVNAVGEAKNEKLIDRTLTTDGYAYLKIADGCSNHCTYCLIPKIRGKYRSIKTDDLIEEVKRIGTVKELILVAQDTTKYGFDLTPKTSLVELIRKLSALENVFGIRLLYCYPENITDELIHEFQCNAKMIRYIDIPLQHADDKVLKLMNRQGTFDGYLSLIEKLKREVFGIAIRSTFMTGFPGEDEKAFNNLVEFIKKAKLFNVGFFKYSREEDTPSYKLDNQVSEKEKNIRLKTLYATQKQVVKENGLALKNKIFKVNVEGYNEYTNEYYGRAYFNAPDVDGKIFFKTNKNLCLYESVNVRIKRAKGYDLFGELEGD